MMKTMNKALGAPLVIAVALSLLGSPAQGKPQEDRSVESQRRVLIQILNAHEFKVSRKAFDRIGPDVGHLLVILSGEPRQRPAVRVRSVASLSVYPTVRTRRYLEGLPYDRDLKKTPLGTLIRRAALQSLASAFTGDVVTYIADFRHDANPQIREACALALGLTGSPRAITPLKAWLPNEAELFVRVAVDRSLNRLMKDASRR